MLPGDFDMKTVESGQFSEEGTPDAPKGRSSNLIEPRRADGRVTLVSKSVD